MDQPLQYPFGLRIVEKHEFTAEVGRIMESHEKSWLAATEIMHAPKHFGHEFRLDHTRHLHPFPNEPVTLPAALMVFKDAIQVRLRNPVKRKGEGLR